MNNIINFNHPYLNNNILHYLGNKKDELPLLDSAINSILKKDKNLTEKNNIFSFVDLFSGSGIVSRYAKLKGFKVISNDLESYAKIITEVPIRYYKEQVEEHFEYVCKKMDLSEIKENSYYLTVLDYLNHLQKVKYVKNNYFAKNFASKEDNGKNHRFFFTYNNAQKIDAIIETIFNNKFFNKETREIVLASLIVSMLNVVNNDDYLTRSYTQNIKRKNKERVLSDLLLEPFVFLSKEELNELNKKLLTADYLCSSYRGYAETLLSYHLNEESFDFVYLDPPYNQQQYSVNYSLLNSACENDKQEVDDLENGKKFETRKDVNKSDFCSKAKRKNQKMAEIALQKTFDSINAKYILYSYVPNSVLTITEIVNIFSNNGNNTIDIKYEKKDLFEKSEVDHCLLIIQKNKRQYKDDIDYLIRTLKSISIIPDNESFSINQKFINIVKLVEENSGWKKVKNSVSNRYKIFNKNKFIFEVNSDLMILSNIDTDFTEEEKSLIEKYFIVEDDIESLNKVKFLLENVVLPSYDLAEELDLKEKNSKDFSSVLPTFNESKEGKYDLPKFDTLPSFHVEDVKPTEKQYNNLDDDLFNTLFSKAENLIKNNDLEKQKMLKEQLAQLLK